jgi:hypothetical protein
VWRVCVCVLLRQWQLRSTKADLSKLEARQRDLEKRQNDIMGKQKELGKIKADVRWDLICARVWSGVGRVAIR